MLHRILKKVKAKEMNEVTDDTIIPVPETAGTFLCADEGSVAKEIPKGPQSD